jgi:hypothetical protein
MPAAGRKEHTEPAKVTILGLISVFAQAYLAKAPKSQEKAKSKEEKGSQVVKPAETMNDSGMDRGGYFF